MKVLIIGSEGFIGEAVSKYFSTQEADIFRCDVRPCQTTSRNFILLNTSDPDYESVFKQHQFDICINASGRGDVSLSVLNPVSDFKENTGTVIKILDAIVKNNNKCRYIHISSAAVYGNPEILPVTENMALQPISPYGFHKQMSEIICREFGEIYELRYLIVRPFSVFGQGLKKQLFWDVCEKLFASSSIKLFGTGEETRDFIHIKDLANLLFILAIKGDFNGSIYNAAAGKEITIRQIADIFQEHYPGSKSISFGAGKKEGYPVNWLADISKVKALGFSPESDLTDKVKEYIDHYIQNKIS